MSEEHLDQLIGLVRRKKNVILQGAPGVGKTFTSKRLAYVMMGMKDKSRIASIQFHQNYSYEDFIMGYKPVGSDFVLQTGVFYDLSLMRSIVETYQKSLENCFSSLRRIIGEKKRCWRITICRFLCRKTYI